MKYMITDPPSFTKDIGLIALSDDFLVNSMWGNILQAEDGYIYIAAGNHATFGGEVWLFRFDPATDEMRLQSPLGTHTLLEAMIYLDQGRARGEDRDA